MKTGDVVQIGSLATEFVGLSLTVVGLLDKDRKARVDAVTIRTFDRIEEVWRTRNKSMARLYIAYLIASCGIICFGDYIGVSETVYALNIVLYISVTFLVLIFGTLRKAFPNHTILSLGLSISFLSLLGEIYQVYMIFHSEGK